jgi:hypothetical protein
MKTTNESSRWEGEKYNAWKYEYSHPVRKDAQSYSDYKRSRERGLERSVIGTARQIILTYWMNEAQSQKASESKD